MTEEPPTEFESTITSKMPEKKEMKGNDSSLLKLIIVVFSCVTMLYLFNMKGYIWFSFHFIAMIVAFILLPGICCCMVKSTFCFHSYLDVDKCLRSCIFNQESWWLCQHEESWLSHGTLNYVIFVW